MADSGAKAISKTPSKSAIPWTGLSFLVGGLCFITLTACENGNDRAAVLAEYIDKDIAEVSLGLAMINAQSSAWKVMCDAIKTTKLMKDECGIYEEAIKQTSEIVSDTRKNKTLPKKAFLFYAWSGKDNGNLGLLTTDKGDYLVGLLKTAADCQKAEQVFRDRDISTRYCRQWEDSAYFLMGKAEDPEQKLREKYKMK